MNLRKRFVKENGSCFQAVYFENWSFNKLLFLREKARKFYTAMTAMLEQNTKNKKQQKKNQEMNSLVINKTEIKKALAGTTYVFITIFIHIIFENNH